MPVPSPGESISEVEIAQWLVKDGDYVEKDQTIAEVDSDKATLDLPAQESGTITLKAQEGDTVLVGDIVCLIDTSGKKVSKKNNDVKPPADTHKENSKVVENKSEKKENTSHLGVPSPAARKILDDKGVNYENVKGSGKGGRISKEDALKTLPRVDIDSISKDRKVDTSKMSLLRRKLSQRLVAVKNQTAMLTTFNEVNMTPIFEIRKKYKETFKAKHEVGLGFMSFFTKAVAVSYTHLTLPTKA